MWFSYITAYFSNLLFFFLISVVKLFNAVSKHQKEMESKLNTAPTEAKKSKGEKTTDSLFSHVGTRNYLGQHTVKFRQALGLYLFKRIFCWAYFRRDLLSEGNGFGLPIKTDKNIKISA